MTPLRRCVLGLLACGAAAALAGPPAANAAPPLNDNYLASTRMANAGAVKRTFSEVVDTSGATTQTDLFNPDRDGLPFGGGPAENTRCGAVQFGATVWYDFEPQTAGAAEIVTAGYDTVVTVYQYNPATARISRTVTCADVPGSGETVQLGQLEAGSYTIQVGGAGITTGLLNFQFSFFGDRDADGILDEIPDACPTLPGVGEAAGCPPELRSAPRVLYRDAPGGIRLTLLTVSGLPSGATVKVRCSRCGASQTRRASRTSVSMSKFRGRVLRAGDRIEIFVTRSKTASGRFRHGAIGNYYRYSVRSGALGARLDRCLKPGKTTPLKRCKA